MMRMNPLKMVTQGLDADPGGIGLKQQAADRNWMAATNKDPLGVGPSGPLADPNWQAMLESLQGVTGVGQVGMSDPNNMHIGNITPRKAPSSLAAAQIGLQNFQNGYDQSTGAFKRTR
jgi:hypothetical protein